MSHRKRLGGIEGSSAMSKGEGPVGVLHCGPLPALPPMPPMRRGSGSGRPPSRELLLLPA